MSKKYLVVAVLFGLLAAGVASAQSRPQVYSQLQEFLNRISFQLRQLAAIETSISLSQTQTNLLKTIQQQLRQIQQALPVTTQPSVTTQPYVSCSPSLGYTPIRTVEDLQNISKDLGGNYFLCNSIDLSGVNFVPLGTHWLYDSFTGVFDGNNQQLINLTMDHERERVGLFDSIGFRGGTVKNLIFVNPSITNRLISEGPSTYGTGVLAGNVYHLNYYPGKIENIRVTGQGYVRGGKYVGGLVGVSYGLIEKSSVDSKEIIVSGKKLVGGLVGATMRQELANWGTIRDSYSSAEVHGDYSVGGLTGANAYASQIERSYASGRVYGSQDVQEVGMFAWTGYGQYFNNIPYNAVFERDYAATLPGFEQIPFVRKCWLYCSKDQSGMRTVKEMTSVPRPQNTYVGWDFVSVWDQTDGNYPWLRGSP